MRGRHGVTDRLEGAVRAVVRAHASPGHPVVLAVSGGRDSMALLHAVARAASADAIVATFDHGTGTAATRAAELVASESARLGFPVVVGRASVAGTTEAEWRAARHAFLTDVARRSRGVVAFAHTRDDQVETVLMRVMRHAGARGLAGLYARGGVLRPLLEFSRAEVAEYAAAVGARWIEDPTNESMRFLRNRVRRDLLPALTKVAPGLEERLIDLSREASGWRQRMDDVARQIARVDATGPCLSVDAAALGQRTRHELAAIWPAVAALAGVAMDWRGTLRAAAFTKESRPGTQIQLSGGWEIARKHSAFELRRVEEAVPAAGEVTLAPGTRWCDWRFTATDGDRAVSDDWTALLPADVSLTVRCWQPGDRMRDNLGRPRKVKRFLSDAHVSGARRARWPVVLAGDEIVWIPGVRRSPAATVRPGRPAVLYGCELDGR